MNNGIKLNILEDGRCELSGRTFDFKDEIKAVGGKWNNANKTWTVPKDTDLEFLNIKKAKPVYIAPYGICCQKAKIMDEYWQGPMYILCEEHGKRPTTKKGFGYTGD
jgi:hypothetical protein